MMADFRATDAKLRRTGVGMTADCTPECAAREAVRPG